MICTWCKKEITDEKQLKMDFINRKKKKDKQSNLKTKVPYHIKCIDRKQNAKNNKKIRGVVSGGVCYPR
jgi:hypothetical protein